MGRFFVTVLVLFGVAYGAWSLLADGEEEAADSGTPLAAVAEAGGASAERGAAAGETAGGAASTTEDAAALRAAAMGKLEAAEKAGSRAEANGRRDEARRLLSRAYFTTTDAAAAAEIRNRLTTLNELVLFSEEPLEGKAFLHTFAATDALWTLCKRTWPKERGVRVEPGFLLWVNGLSDARFIREGQILKVPTEEVALLVEKSKFRLSVLLGGVWIREFTVGLGIADKTPEGEFEIDTKLKNPDWYYDGRKIAYGDPENPLGTRWMGFKRTSRAAGYGIHGTDEPGSVGKNVSQGCVRMENADVEDLFEWVAEGAKVRIVR